MNSTSGLPRRPHKTPAEIAPATLQIARFIESLVETRARELFEKSLRSCWAETVQRAPASRIPTTDPKE